jgi:hypothetical protein
MTAIWPAGPPKVCSEMPNQVRTAVRNGIAGTSGSTGWIRSVWLVTGSPGQAGSRPSSVRRRWYS